MYQKDAAKAAWTAAGLYRSKDAKLRKFLKYFDDSPMDCWPEVVKKARSDYSEYMEQLVQPLWQTGDKLLRVNLIRYADLSHKNEFELLAKLSHKLKADEDRPNSLRSCMPEQNPCSSRCSDGKICRPAFAPL